MKNKANFFCLYYLTFFIYYLLAFIFQEDKI